MTEVMPEVEGLDIVGKLGGGGQADVWWANDRDHQRMVALKVFRRDADPKLYDRERKATGLLSSHENVVHLYRSGALEDGRSYLMLEFADGGSLADHQEGERELIVHMIAIAKAVAIAHENGVIHRDIKPANILLFAKADGSHRAKLGDFGIAAVPGTTTTTSVRGSTAYAPPELLNGHKTDERGDVYALGATMFHALTRQLPPVGSTAEAALQHERNAGSLKATWKVIGKATQYAPEARYGSAREFGEALRLALVALDEHVLATGGATRKVSQASTPAPAAQAQPAAVQSLSRRRLSRVPLSLDSTRNIVGLFAAVVMAGMVVFEVLPAGRGLVMAALAYPAAVLISHAVGHD